MLTKTITVEVTEDDIAEGQRGDATACPIARAIRRLYGDAPEVADYIYITFDDVRYAGPCSDEMSTFIGKFDDGKPVQPFTFTIDLEGYPYH